MDAGCGVLAHVSAGVDQLCRKGGRLLGHLVEARPQPIEAAVDGDRFITRKTAHVAAPPLRPRGRPGDAPPGRPSPVDRMLHIAALPADYPAEIGRAPCRERVLPYVYVPVVAVSLKKKI